MNTKIIRSIITKPLFTALSIIITLGLSLIAFNYDGFIGIIGLVSVGLAVIIMIASVIRIFRLREWGRFIIYLLMHSVLLIVYVFAFLIVAFAPELGQKVMIGDRQFYNEHFERHTSIQDLKLDVYCKQDTIIGIGPGSGDFSAICIFQVDKNQTKEIENKFISDTSFIKLEIPEFEYIIEESKDLECKQNITYCEYGYKSNIRFDMESYFIFSKDKDYLLFYISYW